MTATPPTARSFGPVCSSPTVTVTLYDSIVSVAPGGCASTAGLLAQAHARAHPRPEGPLRQGHSAVGVGARLSFALVPPGAGTGWA